MSDEQASGAQEPTDGTLDALKRELGQLAAEDHRSESRIIAARQALESAQKRAMKTRDLFSELQPPTDVRQAQSALDQLLNAREARTARLDEIQGVIADLARRQQASRQAPLSEPPWRAAPGPAGVTSIYDRAGGWVGDVRLAQDAQHIVGLVNLVATGLGREQDISAVSKASPEDQGKD